MKAFYLLSVGLLFFIHSRGQTDFSVPKSDTTEIFTYVEKYPEFPGGLSALLTFLQSHTIYPESARNKDIEGRVIVRFVVNSDGSLSDFQITQSISTALDSEAVRVARMLPNFIPGRQHEKSVACYVNLPFSFKLSDEEKERNPIDIKSRKDPDFRNALSLIRSNSPEEAIKSFDFSISKFPKDYLSYQLKGDCEFKLGKRKEGCSDYKTAKKKGSPDAADFLIQNCK